MFQEPSLLQPEWIKDFEDKFGLPFSSVKNIMDIGADTNDDGLYHFIDIVTKDIYTFDTNEDEEYWYTKNEMKEEILPDVLPILEQLEREKQRENDRKRENEKIKCRDMFDCPSWRNY